MVQEKLSQLEMLQSTQETRQNLLESKAAQNENLMKECDKLAARMQTIQKDGELDHKQKIAQISDIFNDEIVALFNKAYQDLL